MRVLQVLHAARIDMPCAIPLCSTEPAKGAAACAAHRAVHALQLLAAEKETLLLRVQELTLELEIAKEETKRPSSDDVDAFILERLNGLLLRKRDWLQLELGMQVQQNAATQTQPAPAPAPAPAVEPKAKPVVKPAVKKVLPAPTRKTLPAAAKRP